MLQIQTQVFVFNVQLWACFCIQIHKTIIGYEEIILSTSLNGIWLTCLLLYSAKWPTHYVRIWWHGLLCILQILIFLIWWSSLLLNILLCSQLCVALCTLIFKVLFIYYVFILTSKVVCSIFADPSTTLVTPGPYGLIFASFVPFFFDIPVSTRFRICGFHFSDKSFIYLAGLQVSTT